MSERVSLLGVPVDNGEMDGLVALIADKAASRTFFQVSTINLDFLVHSQTDPEIRFIFAENEVNVPDGAPIVWAGRMLGASAMRRITGADLVPRIAAAVELEARVVFVCVGPSVRGAAALFRPAVAQGWALAGSGAHLALLSRFQRAGSGRDHFELRQYCYARRDARS